MPGAAALDMALDDVISTSWQPNGDKGKSKGRGRGKGSGKSSGRTSKEDSLNMSLDEMIESQESSNKGNGSSWKGKSTGKGKYEDSRDSWGSSYGSSPWSSSWSKGKGKDDGKGYKGGWNGRSKGQEKGGWDSAGKGSGTPPPWIEHDDWRGNEEEEEDEKTTSFSSKGWKGGAKSSGKGKGADSADWRRSKISQDDEDGWGAPPASRWSSWMRPRYEEERATTRPPVSVRGSGMRSDDWGPPPRRALAALDLDRGVVRKRRIIDVPEPRQPRTRVEESRSAGPPVKRPRRDEDITRCKTIKVTNVPRDLSARDIKEAFESEAGHIVTCELERGTCYIQFTRAGDAQKAVETFDRGELNGKTISVVLDP